MNKKGQFESMILLVITIFIIGIILVFSNHLNENIYSSLDDYLESEPQFNNTEAHNVTTELRDIERSSIWDFAFLAIFIGMFIQMLILSFASRTNIVFFWLYIVISMVILMIGTALSNIWQEMASNPTFATTIARFSITNTILGTYYPTIITGVMFFAILIIFGKFPGARE